MICSLYCYKSPTHIICYHLCLGLYFVNMLAFELTTQSAGFKIQVSKTVIQARNRKLRLLIAKHYFEFKEKIQFACTNEHYIHTQYQLTR